MSPRHSSNSVFNSLSTSNVNKQHVKNPRFIQLFHHSFYPHQSQDTNDLLDHVAKEIIDSDIG